MKLINPKHSLPKNRQYVLVYVHGQSWYDDDDTEDNRFFVVAKFVRGLSQSDRDALPESDPRKKTFCCEDQAFGNNEPYCWEPFGPGKFNGQEAMGWCHLPETKSYMQSISDEEDRELKELLEKIETIKLNQGISI